MRLIHLAAISAAIGTVAGSTWAWVEQRPVGSASAPGGVVARPAEDGTAPRVEVDEPTYEFGTMQRGTSQSHEFTLRNVGTAPLMLAVTNTSCKCTVGDVPDAPVPPGESVAVKLEWNALTGVGPFRQTATIGTNDPLNSRITLTVEGKVLESSAVSPPDFIFDKMMTGEEKTAEVFVMALTQDNLEVRDPTFGNEELQQFFEVTIEPVDRASLPNPEAKQGVRVRVTAKPGLPLGHIDQYVALSTNIPDATTIGIPVFGRVVGNISVHGRRWSAARDALMLGNIKSSEGTSEKLNLVIRGDGADSATISVVEVDPPELVVKLGELKQLKPTLAHQPLVIEVPFGTPPMVRLGSTYQESGRVRLKTGHADAQEMVLRVEFTVER